MRWSRRLGHRDALSRARARPWRTHGRDPALRSGTMPLPPGDRSVRHCRCRAIANVHKSVRARRTSRYLLFCYQSRSSGCRSTDGDDLLHWTCLWRLGGRRPWGRPRPTTASVAGKVAPIHSRRIGCRHGGDRFRTTSHQLLCHSDDRLVRPRERSPRSSRRLSAKRKVLLLARGLSSPLNASRPRPPGTGRCRTRDCPDRRTCSSTRRRRNARTSHGRRRADRPPRRA